MLDMLRVYAQPFTQLPAFLYDSGQMIRKILVLVLLKKIIDFGYNYCGVYSAPFKIYTHCGITKKMVFMQLI